MKKVIHDIRRCWQGLEQNNSARLPKWRQLAEMTLLKLFRGIGPGSYLQSRFWRPEIPFSEKWQGANRKEYNQLIDRWNTPQYQKTSQHKVVEKAILTLQQVPTPKFIAYLHAQSGVCASGASLKNFAEFEALCQTLVGYKICLKLVEGFGGAGFSAFKVAQGPDGVHFEHPFTGAVSTLQQWWQQAQQNPDGYIIEHYLEQHPDVAQFHPLSVNTVRIWLYQLPDRVEIACAYLRVGQKGSLVDNTTSGGLYCPVDLETGKLKFGIFSREPWQLLEKHPDSAVLISGVQLPFWQECVQIAGQALRAFPHVHIAGVDVAISKDGPRMIELNVRPDQIGATRLNVNLKRIDQQMKQAYARH